MFNDELDSIFKKAIEGPRIFKNKSALFHDYIPDKLLFRENEIKKLAYLFSNLLRGYRSSNLFIYGKPGTGKTAVTKYVVKKFLEAAANHGKRINFSYVNCRLAGTEYRIVYNIATDVKLSIPFTGLSTEEAFNRVLEKVYADEVPFLLILDEIDSLVTRYGDKLLYMLTRFNTKNKQIPYMIIGISNNLMFKEYLDPRVLSSLSEDEIVFKPYRSDELERIVFDRVKIAFYDNIVDDEAIKLVAALSGAEHGDARKAIDLIRVAGEIAEVNGDRRVTVSHVKKAYSNIGKERVTDTISTLPLHSRIILFSLVDLVKNGYTTVKASILYTKYSEYSTLITGTSLSYRRFIGLLTELSILGLLKRFIQNYGRRGGRSSYVSLDVPIKIIVDSLSNDPVLEDLLHKIK